MLFLPNAAPKTEINSMPVHIALNFKRIDTVYSPFVVSSNMAGLMASLSFLASSMSWKILQAVLESQ